MKKNNSGFTVVELIVSIALLVLILVPVAGFFTNSFKVQAKTSQKAAITRAGQYIVESFKNKDYLRKMEISDSGQEIEDPAGSLTYKNDSGGDSYYEQFLESVELQLKDGQYSFIGSEVNDEKMCEITYKGVEYDVIMGIGKEFEMSDIGNSDIPAKKTHQSCDIDCAKHCDEIIEVKSNGEFKENFTMASGINLVPVGQPFHNPNDNKNYVANYPTIVLTSDFGSSGETRRLWITNEYYLEKGGENNPPNIYNKNMDKQARIRIVKGFPEELKVYKEGINFSVEKGQEGDMAVASHARIRSTFVGEEVAELDNSSSELWLNANMTIINKSNPDIKDVFEFSFPVDYDYSDIKEEE